MDKKMRAADDISSKARSSNLSALTLWLSAFLEITRVKPNVQFFSSRRGALVKVSQDVDFISMCAVVYWFSLFLGKTGAVHKLPT